MGERRRAAATRRARRGCRLAGTCGCPAGGGRSSVSSPVRPVLPSLVLLHGWTATADLNWYACFAPLAEHFRVVAIDHRGHGRGLRSAEPFRLEQCADDVAALARELEHRPVRARRLLDGRTDRPADLAAPPPSWSTVSCCARRAPRSPARCASGCCSASPPAPARWPAPCRSAGSRTPRSARWNELASPAGLPVVGLRRGRPPRLGADRRGRAGDRPLRLAALDRRDHGARQRSW